MGFQLEISEEAKLLGTGNAVVGIIENITNQCTRGTPLEAFIQKSLHNLDAQIQKVQQELCYQGFKTLFAKQGYENQITAADRYAKYVLEHGFKYINGIVDAYNIVSLQNCYPIGGHDYNSVGKKIDIRFAAPGDTIIPIFSTKKKRVVEGNLVYESDNKIMCWMGKKDLDSDQFKISLDTTSALIMAIGNQNTDVTMNTHICREVFAAVKLFSPNSTLEIHTHL